MKCNKRISKLLAKLMLSSLAFSSGVVPTSAMEQQEETVMNMAPTR